MKSSVEENYLADCRSVHARLAEIASTRGALDAREAELLVAADELQIWRVYGQPTLAAYLELTLGYGPHASNERMRVARELAELPQLHAALAGAAPLLGGPRAHPRGHAGDGSRVDRRRHRQDRAPGRAGGGRSHQG